MSDQPTHTSPDEMENCRRPNMLPRQWDLSEILSAPNRNGHHHEQVTVAAGLDGVVGEMTEPSLFDPCPEFNTIPAGWDLSEL